MDVTNVGRRLWLGRMPPVDRDLPGFSALVLCAVESQPTTLAFRGTVIRCQLPLGRLGPLHVARAITVARWVAQARVLGHSVLIACPSGDGRSALVATLAICMGSKASPDSVIAKLRALRAPSCMQDPEYLRIVSRYLRR